MVGMIVYRLIVGYCCYSWWNFILLKNSPRAGKEYPQEASFIVGLLEVYYNWNIKTTPGKGVVDQFIAACNELFIYAGGESQHPQP